MTADEQKNRMKLLRVAAGLAVALCGILLAADTAWAQSPHKPADLALRQELLDRVKQDQAIRNELISKGIKSPDAALLARMQTIDSENTAWMKEIIKQHGWPGPELVGEDGTEAAFLLVQHADHEFQKQALPLVQKAYRA